MTVPGYFGVQDADDICRNLWLETVKKANLLEVAQEVKMTNIKAGVLAKKFGLSQAHVSVNQIGSFAWGELDNAFVGISYSEQSKHVRIEVVANTGTQALLKRLMRKVPGMPAMSDEEVPVTFWTWGPHGAIQFYKNIVAPKWEDIRLNYAADISRPALDDLVKWQPEMGMNGRIGIVHGPPGTGKTTALRSLSRAWGDWCDVSYVADPEVFFHEGAYLFELILGAAEDRWRLFIIEDAEEFLAPNAKERVGQSVARLLNLGDGLIGQGLRVLILMTTNAPLRDLHPAITRPGRCFANIEIPAFTPAEATEWLRMHGIETSVRDKKSVAELFEMRKNGQIKTEVNRSSTGHYL